MAESPSHESRLPIDGKLVDGAAGTFTNVNPATAEVLGEVFDAQEEIFGPVLAVIPYDDEEDAIHIANDSPYVVAGNVMSSSLERSLAVARRLRAGFVGLNGTAGHGADTPFGGYKDSGVGRQNGLVGFSQYAEVKSVAFPAL